MNKLLVANFKSCKDYSESIAFGNAILHAKNLGHVILCPSSLCIADFSRMFKGSGALIAGQNMDLTKDKYTGQITAQMLVSAGANAVIIGHSEVRKNKRESNRVVAEKVAEAKKFGLLPIVCLADQGGRGYQGRIKRELDQIFSICKPSECIIAFEPEWAIGTGNSMDAASVKDILAYVKACATKILKNSPRVLYGGSISRSNYSEYLKLQQADGLFVSSLLKNAEDFICVLQS